VTPGCTRELSQLVGLMRVCIKLVCYLFHFGNLAKTVSTFNKHCCILHVLRRMLMKWYKLVIALCLVVAAAKAYPQICGSGTIDSKIVRCCNNGFTAVFVCVGLTGQCNSLADFVSCGSTCEVGEAGECLSTAKPPFKLTMPLNAALSKKDATVLMAGGGTANDQAFEEWLKRTSTRQR